MPEPHLIRLPSLSGGQSASWHALLQLAPVLGDRCLLVGGQMVLLHEIDRGSSLTRPTDDVDVVVNLRAHPRALGAVHHTLIDAGFDQAPASPTGIAHRYHRASATIDVLAPDHIGSRRRLAIGSGRTIEAPGTSQAFKRRTFAQIESAESGMSATIHFPTLAGAMVAKAAAATKIVTQASAERRKHLQDVESLAVLLGPADRDDVSLSRGERQALKRVAESPQLGALAKRSIEFLIAASDE